MENGAVRNVVYALGAIVGFILGVLELWSIAVALFGGPYPWPFLGRYSPGGDLGAAFVILIGGAVLAVGIFGAVHWVVSLAMIARLPTGSDARARSTSAPRPVPPPAMYPSTPPPPPPTAPATASAARMVSGWHRSLAVVGRERLDGAGWRAWHGPADRDRRCSPVSEVPPPGWYVDSTGTQRWWDGAGWAEVTSGASNVSRGAMLTWLALPAAILLLIALAPLPYAYYVFLRLVVTAITIILAVQVVRASAPGWLGGLIPIAAIWNPIAIVGLRREDWLPLDLLACAFFVIFLVVRLRRSPSISGGGGLSGRGG